MDLAEKIRKIEALIAGSKTEGERQAAEFAKRRLQEKMEATPTEQTFYLRSVWEKHLLTALCRKYGLSPYRYKRQKRTTLMVRVTRPFLDEILWPEFLKYARMFGELAHDIMNDLINKIYQIKEAEEMVIAGELPEGVSSEESAHSE